MTKLKKILAVVLAVCLLAVAVPVIAATVEINSQIATASETKTTAIVDENTSWSYLDDGTDPSAGDSNRHSWALNSFNDSAWKTAAGKFGSKKGELADLSSTGSFIPTVLLNLYIDGSAAPTVPTYFFRTTVTLDADAIGVLNGTIYYDDAAVVYINGTRVAGFYADDLTTNLSYGGSAGTAPLKGEFTVDATLLKSGENTIAIEVHNATNSSSDIWFSAESMSIDPNGEMPTEKNIALTMGEDETQRNITWYEPYKSASASVQYAVKNGDMFPTEYSTATATVTSSKDQGYNYCKATLTNLAPDTEYVYRLVNDSTVSKVYTFSTGANGDFNFIFLSDPQIGANTTAGAANSTASHIADANAWINTLNVASQKFPDAHFLISGGDQVNSGSSEEQYNYFFSPDLSSLAIAPVMGNHDASSNYNEHFNHANTTDYGKYNGSAGCDYWYVYNNVLFMNINTMMQSTAEHKAFMEEAMRKNPHVLWKVVVFHHSLYSIASHSVDADIINRRNELSPVFTELGIDVVLMGHDHTYTRSYIMNNLTPDTSTGGGSVTDPDGVLYITAHSATGSKFYNIVSPNATYAAVTNQEKVPAFSNIAVTPTSFKITTYQTTGTLIDEFEIIKSKANTLEHNPKYVEAKAPTCTEYGNIAYYSCDCNRYYEDANCTTEITDKSSVLIAPTGHLTATHYERVPANCLKDGNIEYWQCDACSACFKDEALTKPVDNVVISSRGQHSGGETYYNDNYHWTLCEHCAEPYNREKHSEDCDCGYEKP
ncbi:MAG: phosphohydrolase [Ruminococcaceae bacterium]|nr:phosphohydrolase [Oscillospiraceae bacterium]